MSTMRWSPTTYARYADERGRPFAELLDRVAADDPRRIVDLGCGPGTLTASLAERWPRARVEGIDSSVDMIEAARPRQTAGLTFEVADAAAWQPPDDLDLLVSNATLQWLPGHRDLLREWADALRPGAWLAVQVPGNFGAPSHRLMREIAQSAPWRDRLAGVLRHEDAVAEPSEYATILLDSGLVADVWETTYSHVLTGTDPVLEWVRGTGLRPVLAALEPAEAELFVDEYRAALREAYPATPHGTVFAFRRIFAVAHRP